MFRTPFTMFGFLGILLLCGLALVVLLVRATAGAGGGGRRGAGGEDDARLIQELYAKAEKMEKRIEALETLLLDRAQP